MDGFSFVWAMIIVSLLLLVLSQNKVGGSTSVQSPTSLKSQLKIKQIELQLKYIELAEKEREITSTTDFSAMSPDVLRELLEQSVIKAKKALSDGVPILRDAYLERIRTIAEKMGVPFETIEQELEAFQKLPEQEQTIVALLGELKDAIRQGDGFYTELRSDNLKPLLRKNRHLKPENYDELLVLGWKNASVRTLREARQAAENKDKFWVDLRLDDAKKYAKRAKIDISKEVADIREIYKRNTVVATN